VIHAGQGGLSASLFRVPTMGNIQPADIDSLVQGLIELMR
jgi:2-aminoethylphosphonate-pyruvate transaminase